MVTGINGILIITRKQIIDFFWEVDIPKMHNTYMFMRNDYFSDKNRNDYVKSIMVDMYTT